MVAKNMYVKSNSGWFSDRSVCYLASGRPVAAQDTGWTANYPVRDGLLAFRTTEEAACAVQDLDEHYDAHRRGAREVAEEFFDSDQVLADLLVAVGAR
jgi:glycosyltransferase involved in cell wall biosynthesis